MTKEQLLKEIGDAYHEGDEYNYYNYHKTEGGVLTQRITNIPTSEIIGRIILGTIVETITIYKEVENENQTGTLQSKR